MKFYQSLFFALLCCASLRIQGAAAENGPQEILNKLHEISHYLKQLPNNINTIEQFQKYVELLNTKCSRFKEESSKNKAVDMSRYANKDLQKLLNLIGEIDTCSYFEIINPVSLSCLPPLKDDSLRQLSVCAWRLEGIDKDQAKVDEAQRLYDAAMVKKLDEQTDSSLEQLQEERQKAEHNLYCAQGMRNSTVQLYIRDAYNPDTLLKRVSKSPTIKYLMQTAL